MKTTWLGVDLGQGERGQRRKAALLALAQASGYYWGGKPSIGRFICYLADSEIETQERSDNNERLFTSNRR